MSVSVIRDLNYIAIKSASLDISIYETQYCGKNMFIVKYLDKVRYYPDIIKALDHVSKKLSPKDREELARYFIAYEA